MAVQFVEPTVLRCSGCGASKDYMILVKRHRFPRGKEMLCMEVYHCQTCQHQTGTVWSEPIYPVNQAAVAR